MISSDFRHNYSPLELALYDEDLGAVQRLLAPRDECGFPTLDLNGWYGGDVTPTALKFAIMRVERVNVPIIQALLQVRDNQGYPVIDVNAQDFLGRTVIADVLYKKMPIRVKRELLQSFLDLRGPKGELIVNLRCDACDEEYTLLYDAFLTRDIHCLRMLLDARLANGERALNVNQRVGGWRTGLTLLDFAQQKDSPWYKYNQELVDAIKAAGGLNSGEVSNEQGRRFQPTDVFRPLPFALIALLTEQPRR